MPHPSPLLQHGTEKKACSRRTAQPACNRNGELLVSRGHWKIKDSQSHAFHPLPAPSFHHQSASIVSCSQGCIFPLRAGCEQYCREMGERHRRGPGNMHDKAGNHSHFSGRGASSVSLLGGSTVQWSLMLIHCCFDTCGCANRDYSTGDTESCEWPVTLLPGNANVTGARIQDVPLQSEKTASVCSVTDDVQADVTLGGLAVVGPVVLVVGCRRVALACHRQGTVVMPSYPEQSIIIFQGRAIHSCVDACANGDTKLYMDSASAYMYVQETYKPRPAVASMRSSGR
ncbi:uncharacterized protein K460DRAFT_354899 [Cucurbitaria berberidis CBS 394.84]|uniref:Uncharacterized protein n=1 Tax=Cucurbitaria berberidis CBS 394.84 TaxID=1168544 RepID=A0A9P4GGI7_9PLEO|nr:uncharacterized protein K460DRAFT_354899 [Cucurbitaria berberidis CBS 394.84]KAF1845041.1 hypothetical protein K460DRAFT_354899 [Cucurbitaria berberidis CBS 394.84]